MDTTSFSYCALGVYGTRNIKAHAIAFATVAKLHDKDKVWDDVIALMLSRMDTAMPAEAIQAEAMPAETDPPVADTTAAQPATRKRRTKAEMEAARQAETLPEPVAPNDAMRELMAAYEANVVGAIEATPPAPVQEGPSLQDALEAMTKGEPITIEVETEEAPAGISREDLEAKVRVRAKAGPEGTIWLREHVMCGAKYTRFAEVPADVLLTALAI